MYLKVSIPLRYAVPESVSDSTPHDMKPFHERYTSHPAHNLFLSLKSYQLPWRQFNSKGLIYEVDDVHTLYPAFRTTSKLRPKMMPSKGRMSFFTLGNMGSHVKYGARTESSNQNTDYKKWKTTNRAEAERKYAEDLTGLCNSIYDKAYKGFCNTRLKPVSEFMEWVGSQKDIVGFYNNRKLSREELLKHSNIYYDYSGVTSEDGKTSTPHVRVREARSLENIEDINEELITEIDQTAFSSIPYESHPEFGQAFIPLKTIYEYKQDMDEKRGKMLHPDRRYMRNNSAYFEPPILDWKDAGYPKVAESSTKALYRRKPIHQQFIYEKSGFIGSDLVWSGRFLQKMIEQSEDCAEWFEELAQPIDTSQKEIFKHATIYGSIRSVSVMSENKLTFSRPHGYVTASEGTSLDVDLEKESMGQMISYESQGKSYDFIVSRSFGSNNADAQKSFARDGIATISGIPPIYNWEDLEYIPVYTSGYNIYGFYNDALQPHPDWDWTQGKEKSQFAVIRHPLARELGKWQTLLQVNASSPKSKQLRTVSGVDTPDVMKKMSVLGLNQSRIYPRLNLVAATQAYNSYPVNERGRHEMRWVKSRPNQYREEGVEQGGMEIIEEILERNLIPNEPNFDPNGNPTNNESMVSTLPRLLSAITRHLGSRKFSVSTVPVKQGKAVKITQDLTLKPDTDFTSDVLANMGQRGEQGEALRLYMLSLNRTKELKGESFFPDNKVEYSIILYISPDSLTLSCLEFYPSILMESRYGGRGDGKIRPFLLNYDLVEGFRKYATQIFQNESVPYLLHPPSRYSSSNELDVINIKKNNTPPSENPLDQWQPIHYLKPFSETTVFNDYAYNLCHFKSGMTVSDPLNTLPIDIKRNKITVTRPFTYTSIFPVLGNEVDLPIYTERINMGYNKDDMRFNYSPVALYTIEPEPPDIFPTNVPEKIFKSLNTNARTFKAQRNEYIQTHKANDFTDFDSIILPFQNITEEIVALGGAKQNYGSNNAYEWAQLNNKYKDEEKEGYESYQMPYFKQTNADARGDGKRTQYLPNNLSNWSLGVPTEFIPETYSLTGMELGLFNWPLGLV